MTDWIVATALISIGVAVLCLGIAGHAAASLIRCQQAKEQPGDH